MESKSTRNNRGIVILIGLCLLLSCLPAHGQEAMKGWSGADLNAANTTEGANYLSAEEKKALYYLNLIRLNGPRFAETFLKAYLDTCHEKIEERYIVSLRRDLAALKRLPAFRPMEDLFEEARDHAKEMGKTGKVGHSSPSGKSFKARMMKFSKVYRAVGENCDYGNNTGFDVVMSLLIDQGVEDLGHRKNMLSPDYLYTGISILPHKKYRFNCVMDFGAELVNRK